MNVKSARIGIVCATLGACFIGAGLLTSQEALRPPEQAAGEAPKGVEVQARGPVHEAFASPLTEPKATPQISKKPPAPIDEMPPEEKPEGDVVWIGGYFAYDEDRADFLWVSGCWRTKPIGKDWVPGYWREVGVNWQWVPGFWANAQTQEVKASPVTYYPEPPAPPNVAPAGDPPAADMIYVPGYWMWSGDVYRWRAGYWTRVRSGYVYVPSHYRWTPSGYVFVSGYWDYSVARRGVLYAPVTVDVVVLGPRYVYTPYYAVRDTIVLDTLFVRASYGAFYFGDYYGPRYVGFGFEPYVVYGRRHYEPIFVYERWDHRNNPRWHDAQIRLAYERNAGRAALPARGAMVAPARTVMLARGEKVVRLDAAARVQVARASLAHHQALQAERRRTETGGPITRPRQSALNVTPARSGGAPLGGSSATRDAGRGAPSLDSKGTTIGRDGAKTTTKDRPLDTKKSDDRKKKGKGH